MCGTLSTNDSWLCRSSHNMLWSTTNHASGEKARDMSVITEVRSKDKMLYMRVPFHDYG